MKKALFLVPMLMSLSGLVSAKQTSLVGIHYCTPDNDVCLCDNLSRVECTKIMQNHCPNTIAICKDRKNGNKNSWTCQCSDVPIVEK